MRTILAPAALAMALALAGPAAAQPALKLPVWLSGDVTGIMWCSAVFYEESFYWDEDPEVGRWYDELSIELEDQAETQLEREGRSRDQIDDLWEALDNTAEDLAARDEDGYFAELENCETQFAGLIPHPMS